MDESSASRLLSAEAELLGCRRVAWRDHDRALEHLRPEESLHQLVVEAMAEGLRREADGGGVLGRVGGSLSRESPLEDPLGGPPVDGVRGHFDLEHPAGHVLAYPRACQPGLPRRALERLEFSPAFVG